MVEPGDTSTSGERLSKHVLAETERENAVY
jgi:hypothetical protein